MRRGFLISFSSIALLSTATGCHLFENSATPAQPTPSRPTEQPKYVASAIQPTAPTAAALGPNVQPATTGPAAQLLPDVSAYVDRVSAASDPTRIRPVVDPAPADSPAATPTAEGPASRRRAPVAVPIDEPEFAVESIAAPDIEVVAEPAPPPRTPRVERVTARGAAPTESAKSIRHASHVEINAPVEASRIPNSIKGFLDQNVPEGGAGDYRQQLDDRILRVLAGDYGAARRPLDLVTAEQQRVADSIVNSLISVREANLADPSRIGESAVAALAELTSTLRSLGDLQIPQIAICWRVDGFGRYEEFNPPHFPAARENELIVYSELDGFASEQRADGAFYTRFEITTTVLDRIGNQVVQFREPEIVDRCRNRRTDCFIPHLIRLPASLSPGDYVVKVTIADKLGNKVAENRAEIRLVARA